MKRNMFALAALIAVLGSGVTALAFAGPTQCPTSPAEAEGWMITGSNSPTISSLHSVKAVGLGSQAPEIVCEYLDPEVIFDYHDLRSFTPVVVADWIEENGQYICSPQGAGPGACQFSTTP